MKKKTENKKAEETIFEVCILCGKKTHIPIDTPIAARQGYIEGSGQLCPDCYQRINTRERT